MKKPTKRLTLNRETLRLLAGETLQQAAGGAVPLTQTCPRTHTCDSCFPCTIGQTCVSGVACTA